MIHDDLPRQARDKRKEKCKFKNQIGRFCTQALSIWEEAPTAANLFGAKERHFHYTIVKTMETAHLPRQARDRQKKKQTTCCVC
eukprot:COSAG06_NODE_3136_length_5804_cov_2.662752_5_plen_84_part_00